MSQEEEEAKKEAALAESRMTLGEHLSELRRRLFRGVMAIAVLFVLAYIFKDEVSQYAQRPYTRAMTRLKPVYIERCLALLVDAEEPVLGEDVEAEWIDFFEGNPEGEPSLSVMRKLTPAEFESLLQAAPEKESPWTHYFEANTEVDPVPRDFRRRVTFIGAFESVVYQLKICFYAALVLGSPFLLWQMWQFIAAGLYKREKRAILRYFPVSLAAFGAGISFGFLVIVPQSLYYINVIASVELGISNITASEYLSFLSSLCVAFGFIFQMPLILTFLGSMGIVDARTLGKYRGEFMIGAFVIAAVLTPPEPFTQIIMGLPMVILFELGIIGARLGGKRREKAEAEEAAKLR